MERKQSSSRKPLPMPPVEAMCTNTEDIMGEPLDLRTSFIAILSVGSDEKHHIIASCYIPDQLQSWFESQSKVYEWGEDHQPIQSKPVFKLPNTGEWIDQHGYNNLRRYNTLVLIKKGSYPIGSSFGVSQIHGREEILWTLYPIHRKDFIGKKTPTIAMLNTFTPQPEDKVSMFRKEIVKAWNSVSASLNKIKITLDELKYIVTSPTLIDLSLRGNTLIGPAVIVLAQSPILTSLDLTENWIGDRGAKALSTNTSLTRLYLGDNNITNRGANALAQNRSLTTLHLCDNGISDNGAMSLALNTTLKELNLTSTKVDDAGVESLAGNTTLTSLFLEDNVITNKGANALAQNRTLTTLHLCNNNMSDNGAIALAKNTSLTSLNLEYNDISNRGAFALAQTTTLKHLFIKHNDISENGIDALRANRTLIELDYEPQGPDADDDE